LKWHNRVAITTLAGLTGGRNGFYTQVGQAVQSRLGAFDSTQTVIPLGCAMLSLDGNTGTTSIEFHFTEPLEKSASLLRAWLTWLGLHFNPFQPLDASADARLSDYLVEHHILATIWGDWHSFVFAPAGGGKTALRMRTSQLCWVGQATNHPFSISYLPPFLIWRHTHPSRDEHLEALAQAGAIRLLLALVYRPHWFLELRPLDQQAVYQSLVWNLPGNLNFWLSQVEESQSIAPLLDIFDPTFILPDPPNALVLQQLCNSLRAQSAKAIALPDPIERWNHLVDVLLRILGFRAIYILIDGLDAVQETATDVKTAVECLATLLPLIDEWQTQPLFIKGYLPQDTRDYLTARFPSLVTHAQTATIQWTPALLAEVVRRRVYVASEGAFGSLDAIASPAIRDLETVLAKIAFPLPREMLVLTQRVLVEHINRFGATGIIQPEDVDAALAWYQAQHPTASHVAQPIVQTL
jgi:hypothetical protein